MTKKRKLTKTKFTLLMDNGERWECIDFYDREPRMARIRLLEGLSCGTRIQTTVRVDSAGKLNSPPTYVIKQFRTSDIRELTFPEVYPEDEIEELSLRGTDPDKLI